MYTIDQLNEALQGIVTVTFTKKSDGSVRRMKCTKNLDKIATTYHPLGKVINDKATHCRVFDLEKSAWRSFDIDTVTDVCVD